MKTVNTSNHSTTTKCHPCSIIGIVIISISFVIIVMTTVLAVIDRTDFNEQNYERFAEVTSIHKNPYRCCETRDCSCTEASNVPSCTTRIRDITPGYCSNGKRCCARSSRTTSTGKSTYTSSYCSKDVNNDKCTSFCANCTKPTIYYDYTFNQESYSDSSSIKYPIDDYECLDNFLQLHQQGDEIPVWISKEDPSRSTVIEPDYSLQTYLLVLVIVFPILFVIGLIMLLCDICSRS